MKIAFIGGGNMAAAMLGGMLQQGFVGSDLYVLDRNADKRERFAQQGIQTLDQDAALPDVDVVVLAIKPQQLAQVAKARAKQLAGKLVISIAAGIRMQDLDRWLGGSARLIRVMPNTPALVQAGMAGAWLGPRASALDKQACEQILSSTGQVMWVQEETQIDAVAAISGSGPAYVFHFMESLLQAGQQLGFTADEARTLVYATFAGAVKLAQASSEDIATLRQNVTSKGGTTQAALGKMAELGLAGAIAAGAQAAVLRAGELADQLGSEA